MSTQENYLKAIADAIREKDGSTQPIVAGDFSARILAIPAGTGSGGGLALRDYTSFVLFHSYEVLGGYS